MKKYLFMGCFLVIAGLIFAQTAPSKDRVAQAARLLGVSEVDLQRWVDSKFVSVPTGIPAITAEQLWIEYKESQPRADRAYKGKQIKVTGVVKAVEEEQYYDGDQYQPIRYALKLKGNDSYNTVWVFFDDSDLDAVFDIANNQSVSIIGTLIKKNSDYTIIIEHAKIVQ
ncbi:hypothetical protein FACS1894151_11320 [Spirochaetia bacterium]|nr:hypothetical protein FACS1894151_11320 [Spirochaetia bacterium]